MESTYVSIGDYAKNKGVSTQAVYKQIKAHQSALKGLIITDSGKRWLSQDAVKILDDASKASAIIYVDEVDKAKLEDAELRIQELQEQLQIAQDKLSKAQDMIISLQADKIDCIGITERSKLLLEQKDMELQKTKNRNLWQRIFNRD